MLRNLGQQKCALLLLLALGGCAENPNVSASMTQAQANGNLLRSLAERVAKLEATQQAISEQLASATSIRVPSGITAIPAQRRSGVYDDQPIRAALDQEQSEGDGLDQGVALYQAGDIDNAINTLQQFLNQGDISPQRRNLARYWLGDAYYNQRQYDTANRYLGLYLREAPQGEKASVALEKLIDSLRISGRTEDADVLSQYGVQAIVGS